MSRLIWIYAVCKNLLLSHVAVKELNIGTGKSNIHENFIRNGRVSPIIYFDTLIKSRRIIRQVLGLEDFKIIFVGAAILNI